LHSISKLINSSSNQTRIDKAGTAGRVLKRSKLHKSNGILKSNKIVKKLINLFSIICRSNAKFKKELYNQREFRKTLNGSNFFRHYFCSMGHLHQF
jgi:hypothetical protein